MFEERFKRRLDMQRQAGLYRNPPEVREREGKCIWIGTRKVLNFASNDYLGLSTSLELKERVAENFRKYGTSSSSSRLVSGHYSIISHAEKAYARHFGYHDALFFPSGYQANLGIISTLFDRGDTVIFDKHIHASSVKGMALSRAEFLGYKHNSMSHLQKRLEVRKERPVGVLTESLFSMDGDFLNMRGIGELKDRYGFLSVVDEAHAFGALGRNGRGIAREVADIAVGTFGKALGLFGAFVLLPEGFKEYLFNFCSPLIYSTTLPEAHAASALDLLEIVSSSEDKRELLRRNSRIMKEALTAAGFQVGGDAHVLAVEIGDEARAAAVARGLFERDIFVLAARYPTVPLGRAILRIGMTALHTEEDATRFVEALEEADGKTEPKRN
jgi:8-amino-7-oxononanoate synthase